jgi:hypothetical protein
MPKRPKLFVVDAPEILTSAE